MEPETQVDLLRKKISTSIDRSAELITADKHYEFTQKIKMLAQRKVQTNKSNEAEILLELGIKKMLSQEEVKYNATNDLITALIELYEADKSLWHQEKTILLFNILTAKPNEKNTDFFQRIIKSLSSIRDAPEMTEYIIASYEKSENFSQAEKYVARVDMGRTVRFLEQWHSKVDNDEYCIIVCRMALLKGYHGENFDESMVLLSELDCLNAFVKFTKFLILSVQMNSKESYQKIGICYKQFLSADTFFEENYESYGIKFFKMEKASSGIMGLLQG